MAAQPAWTCAGCSRGAHAACGNLDLCWCARNRHKPPPGAQEPLPGLAPLPGTAGDVP